MYISRFTSIQPPFLVAQKDGLQWLGEAHARHSRAIDADRLGKMLSRFGCGPEQIERRGTWLRDFTHRDWSAMQIFTTPPGSLDQRMAFFNESLLPPLTSLYQSEEVDFAHWIHVTCTGYISPSLIQTLVSRLGWGNRVQCLNAYHMGCYAAFPALRMARGNLDCEILHTELCTLHLNPECHEPAQLVIQSLFADGVIRYRVTPSRPARGFALEDMREIVVPQSLTHMTWDVSNMGFAMTLAREVPDLVEQGVAELVKPWRSARAVYAIHPGGPRIIDAVQKALGLSDEQVDFSRQVLRLHGNMSSATLPHVWQRMLAEVSDGTPVISMAFGPGLTLTASLMSKVGRP